MRALLPVVFMLSLSACATLLSPIFSAPKIESSRVDVGEVSAQAVGADVLLNVRNPNSFAVPVERISARVEIEGAESLDFSWKDLPELKPDAVTEVRLPFKLPWSNVGSMAMRMLQGQELPYVIKGRASLKGIEVPFEKSGSIPLLKSGSEKN